MGFFHSKPDSELIEAYEVLYRQNYDRVYRVVLSLAQDPELTLDAVQQAFLKGFLSLHSLKDKAKFPAWITVIALNEAKSFLRNQSRHKVIPFSEDLLDAQGVQDQAITLLEEEDEINQVLGRLKPHESQIIMLRYYAELSLEEIAEVMNISMTNAKTRLYRARLKLKSLLRRREN